jgi:Fe-S-cluster containining protein
MKKKSIEKLEALYKRIPEIECKGLCHPSCTIVPAEDLEIKRARKRMSCNPFRVSNKDLELAKTTGKIPSCGALKDNRCTIHSVRPAICRLYGSAEGLECPFGCQSKKEKLSRQEAYSIIREIRDI